MDDALVVRGLERLGDLRRHGDRFVDRDRPALQALGEVLAVHQLQHEEELPLRLLEAVDGGDAGVVECGKDLRLAPEPGEPLGVLRHLAGQHLEGDLAPELRVGRAVHLAHAAGADRRRDPVVGERLACQDVLLRA